MGKDGGQPSNVVTGAAHRHCIVWHTESGPLTGIAWDATLYYKVLYHEEVMQGWLRTLRGMIGIGLTFSAGVGVVAGTLAGLVSLLPGSQGGAELFRLVAASSLWAFPIGLVFSGVTAITARAARFEELSMARFAAIGAGAGLPSSVSSP